MLDPVAGVVLASTQRTIGIVIVVLLALAGLVLLWFNSRAIELPFSSCANLQQRTIL